MGLYAKHRSEIAAVVIDMAMPVMNGPAAVVALKAINPTVKIIGSSGHASEGGATQAVAVGCRHFVSRPYTAETLLTTLQRLLAEEVGQLANAR